MKNSIYLKAIIFSIALLISNQLLSNQHSVKNIDSTPPSIFDDLNYQELLDVELEFNTEKLFKDRRIDQVVKGIFSYKNKEGVTQNWDVKISQRGKFRRLKCEKSPPLRLDFKKEDLTNAGLANFDDLKLVTHCVNDIKEAKKLLIKEYLAYKIYNEITDQSFRVQFVRINYKNQLTGKEEQQFGFIIEDTAQLRARLDVKKVSGVYNLDHANFNTSQVKVVSVFNYMIGNADWSIENARNVKLFSKDGKFILIPYDFDFSGLVDAPYVVLKKEQGINSVKERIFLGFKEYQGTMNSVLRYFKKKKSAIWNVVNECNLLDKREKGKILDYLDSFFWDPEI